MNYQTEKKVKNYNKTLSVTMYLFLIISNYLE